MSKARDFSRWIDRAFEPPEAKHGRGWCRECDREVWLCFELTPFGMADSCEEHLPLCEIEEGGSG